MGVAIRSSTSSMSGEVPVRWSEFSRLGVNELERNARWPLSGDVGGAPIEMRAFSTVSGRTTHT